MANMKIVYGTILPDTSSEETIMVILLCAVLETLKVPAIGAQTNQYQIGKEPFQIHRYDQNM
jgi:hypothetical protein